jgi:hypothetical protein
VARLRPSAGVDVFPERSTATQRGFRPHLDRAAMAGSLVAILIALSVTVMGSLDGWPVLSRLAAVTLLGVAGGTAVSILVVPRGILRAFGTYSWLGRREVDRFVARTGGPVPTSVETFEPWLAAHPSQPADALPRAEVLAFIGRFDEARAELATLDGRSRGTSVDVERAVLAQYIDWLDTGRLDLADLESVVSRAPAVSPEGRMGAVSIALARARDAFMRGDPVWYQALADARAPLGREPRSIVIRDTWRVFVTTFAIGALGTHLVVSALRGIA